MCAREKRTLANPSDAPAPPAVTDYAQPELPSPAVAQSAHYAYNAYYFRSAANPMARRALSGPTYSAGLGNETMSLRLILRRMSIMLKTAAIILFALSVADLVQDHIHPGRPQHGVIGTLGLVGSLDAPQGEAALQSLRLLPDAVPRAW